MYLFVYSLSYINGVLPDYKFITMILHLLFYIFSPTYTRQRYFLSLPDLALLPWEVYSPIWRSQEKNLVGPEHLSLPLLPLLLYHLLPPNLPPNLNTPSISYTPPVQKLSEHLQQLLHYSCMFFRLYFNFMYRRQWGTEKVKELGGQ